MVAGVVAGGDAVGADLAGGDEELVELEVVVAEGAGDGGAAGEVLGDEGLDDFGFEAVLLVDDVVGDVELLGYVACVVDVVDGAAAALDGFGHAFVSGEAALVPELEGEADEGVALERGGVRRRRRSRLLRTWLRRWSRCCFAARWAWCSSVFYFLIFEGLRGLR